MEKVENPVRNNLEMRMLIEEMHGGGRWRWGWGGVCLKVLRSFFMIPTGGEGGG